MASLARANLDPTALGYGRPRMYQTPLQTLPRFLAILVFNLLLFLVLLLGVELFLRWHDPEARLYERTFPGEYQNTHLTWAREEPDLGWVFSGEGTNRFKNEVLRELQVDYHANSQGFRADVDFDAVHPDSSTSRIMMLGDSFVFGVYLDEADTLPRIIQKKLGDGPKVFNLGIPGWGIDQMYWAYKKYADLIRPDTVVLCYIEEDIYRVFEAFRKVEKLNKPSYDLVDGRLVYREPSERSLLERLASVSFLFNRLYRQAYRDYKSNQIVEVLMSELMQDSRRRGERLVVVRLPHLDEIREARKGRMSAFADLFAGTDVAFLDPREAMRELAWKDVDSFYLPNDSHPSGKGNSFFADYIVEHALREGETGLTRR